MRDAIISRYFPHARNLIAAMLMEGNVLKEQPCTQQPDAEAESRAGRSSGFRRKILEIYDYQCAVCRRLSPRLKNLQGVDLTWHDLASLGAASETAARAAIAARVQGKFETFHTRLMRAAFQPNEGYIRLLSESIGVDETQLLADMYSPQTDQQLWVSRALADTFGMLGTPGMVIGKTVIIGNVNDKTLNRIVEMEQTGPNICS